MNKERVRCDKCGCLLHPAYKECRGCKRREKRKAEGKLTPNQTCKVCGGLLNSNAFCFGFPCETFLPRTQNRMHYLIVMHSVLGAR